ncbi:hypothetical protein [Saccharopolyspora spinosa]|uniref:hypothetical protein n=1 Tax=Saccharopolyspora spinosa TaxID=60894 RepID=UPI000497F873|nr:hypothetical protein [Saccharopolyspora spinosa]
MTTVRELAGELLEALAEEDPLNELLQGLPGIDHRLNDLDELAQSALRQRALRIADTPASSIPGQRTGSRAVWWCSRPTAC